MESVNTKPGPRRTNHFFTMRRPSLVSSSFVLTSLMPWKALSEQRHQSSGSTGETTSSPYQTSSQQIPSSNSRSRGYPLSTSGVPKKRFDGAGPWAGQQEKGRFQQSLARQSQFTRTYDPFLDDSNFMFNAQSRVGSSSNDQDIPPDYHRTPIVYRYYPRQNARNQSAGSVPFLLLGPNVDHWKVTAQQLSARGFNVIAVASASAETRPEGGPALLMVSQLLDALRWNKAVLVGCDGESVLAIQVALQLAPERIAGLILCGNLNESESLLTSAGYGTSIYALDQYLHNRLACPFTIIWDGDPSTGASVIEQNTDTVAASSSNNASPSVRHRTVVIGGGSAPHRRRPEMLAWILTRFVEDKIAPPVTIEAVHSKQHRETARRRRHHHHSIGVFPPWRDDHHEMHLPWYIDEMFHEESFVVFGRVAATALFYAMMVKVLFYQYDNVRDAVDFMASVKRNIVNVIKTSVCSILSVSLSFRQQPRGETSIRLREGSEDAGEARVATLEEGTNDEDGSAGSMNGDKNDENMPEDENVLGDDRPLENEPPKKDLPPMFFLDHVVA